MSRARFRRLVAGGLGWCPRLEGNDNAVRADVSGHIQAISLNLSVPERHSRCGRPAPSARTRLRPCPCRSKAPRPPRPKRLTSHITNNMGTPQGPLEPRTEGKYSAIWSFGGRWRARTAITLSSQWIGSSLSGYAAALVVECPLDHQLIVRLSNIREIISRGTLRGRMVLASVSLSQAQLA